MTTLSPLFPLGMHEFRQIGETAVQQSSPFPTNVTFSYLPLGWPLFFPKFPWVFVDMASVRVAQGGGINHTAGEKR